MKVYEHKTQLRTCEHFIGESIEEKMRRVTQSNEPIEDTAPQIYTERKDGVLPQYDIRTDRFDIALEAIDKADKALMARREEAAKVAAETQTLNEDNTIWQQEKHLEQ